MYKYLLWDIDGTVLDFLASEAYAIRALFKKYNIGECDDEKLRLYSGINVKYWQKLERGEMTKPEILVERFREFFGIIGVDASIAESFNRDYQVTLGDHIEFVGDAEKILLSQKEGMFLRQLLTVRKSRRKRSFAFRDLIRFLMQFSYPKTSVRKNRAKSFLKLFLKNSV